MALIACCSAQTLKFNPLVLGSTQAAAEQVIQLLPGGGLGSARLQTRPIAAALAAPPARVVVAAPRPLAIAPRPVAIAPRPVAVAPVAVAQPQFVTIAAAPALAPVSVARPSAVAVSARDEDPEPYQFSYTSTDEFGTTLTRQEQSDQNGVVSGSYGYQDASGLFRQVEYIADENGFRATVRTNEPGTANANPADVIIESQAAPSRR